MASAFSHAVVAVALGKTIFPSPMGPRFWWLSVVCSILSDADVVGFAFGIPYGHPFGHRGLSHSLLFAMTLSLLVVRIGFADVVMGPTRRVLLFTHFFLVTASHGLLDAMTNGGLGIAFFAPFDTTRYFLPWRPVKVSPIGVVSFFSRYGMEVMVSEVVWIWVPALVVAAVVMVGRRSRTGP